MEKKPIQAKGEMEKKEDEKLLSLHLGQWHDSEVLSQFSNNHTPPPPPTPPTHKKKSEMEVATALQIILLLLQIYLP